MANIHPAGTTVAFWKWAKKLNELIFWARESDAETTTRDGWRDAMKRDIAEVGTLARDDSPDDMTRNQVTRSRSLALQLVRMLNECGDLNAVPCRNWSAVDRQTVEQLAELQAIFARIGDGERDEPSTGRERANGSEYSPWIDSPKMIEMMKANGIRGTSDAAIKRAKRTWQAEAQTGSNNQRFRLKFSTLDELGIKYPAEWNTSEA